MHDSARPRTTREPASLPQTTERLKPEQASLFADWLRIMNEFGRRTRSVEIRVTRDREQFLAAGMDDYLAKPFDPEELDAVLARIAGLIR